ncbi:MAG: hypothetical protein UU08_C0033G0002 [Candidatus Uhrbacteria bacterium GW2011_GWE2_40_58]|nr:MAG: hypothetical protein UU08_C0033G0002 [Candidatus Uhrbacteria bacterium GW2011_GWE2_40_58]
MFPLIHNQMFKKSLVISLSVALVFGSLIVTFPVHAASAPNLLNYQGRVLNSNGVPVADSTLDVEFRLYDALSGGTCLWSNSSTNCSTSVARSVTLTSGLFSEQLGDTAAAVPYAAITDSVFADNSGVYLEVEIEGETLTPRKRMVAAPYALNAQTGVFDFGGADSFELVNGTTPTVNTAGELAIDTDADGDLIDQGVLTYYDGSTQMYVIAIDGISGFSDNDVVVYDAATDKWLVEAQAGGASQLSDLSDVNTSTATFHHFSWYDHHRNMEWHRH